MRTIDYCGEGPVDAEVARKLIVYCGYEIGADFVTMRKGRGKNTLDKRIPGLAIRSEAGHKVLVLRDLDQDDCAPTVVSSLKGNDFPNLLLRIAVKSIESWLLADNVGISAALSVSDNIIPRDPERLPSPKRALVEIGKNSRSKKVRSVFSEGFQVYSGWIIDFVRDQWSLDRAIQTGAAPSLNRTVLRLQACNRQKP